MKVEISSCFALLKPSSPSFPVGKRCLLRCLKDDFPRRLGYVPKMYCFGSLDKTSQWDVFKTSCVHWVGVPTHVSILERFNEIGKIFWHFIVFSKTVQWNVNCKNCYILFTRFYFIDQKNRDHFRSVFLLNKSIIHSYERLRCFGFTPEKKTKQKKKQKQEKHKFLTISHPNIFFYTGLKIILNKDEEIRGT